MSEPVHAAARRSAPPLVRTALALLPLQVALRGGEALLPLLLAACFGRSRETDVYYLLAAYFVFASAIVTAAFQDSGAVPVLIQVGASEPELLPEIAGALLGHTWFVGGAVGFGMGALAAVVAHFTSPMPTMARELAALFAAVTVATSVRAFYVGLLNSRGVFRAHPIASGVGMALTWVVLLSGRHALGVRVIPLASLAGEIVAVVVLRTVARRVFGFAIAPNLRRSEPIRRIFTLVRLEVTGSLVTRINPLVDQIMAGLAGVVGGGTLVRYATDVAALPTSLLQAALFPVLLTRLAHEANRPRDFVATTRRTLAIVVVLLLAAAAFIIAIRRPLCALLFARGAMDAAGVERIVAILPWAVVGAAPFGALLVLARAHVALQNSRIMPSMGILNGVLNAAFNALFVGGLGLSGIALSTSVTYVVVALVFWLRLPRSGHA
ncbi:MAG: lipid II flippase MurJ [Polyangiaceae bacterium]|jgi:putative peptidoglycan lipid II flippase